MNKDDTKLFMSGREELPDEEKQENLNVVREHLAKRLAEDHTHFKTPNTYKRRTRPTKKKRKKKK